MIGHLLIGASLVALGVIVAGSLDSVRVASLELARAEERVPVELERTARQIGWPVQGGAAVEQLRRMPKIISGK
jgi:hypothetical protein